MESSQENEEEVEDEEAEWVKDVVPALICTTRLWYRCFLKDVFHYKIIPMIVPSQYSWLS